MQWTRRNIHIRTISTLLICCYISMLIVSMTCDYLKTFNQLVKDIVQDLYVFSEQIKWPPFKTSSTWRSFITSCSFPLRIEDMEICLNPSRSDLDWTTGRYIWQKFILDAKNDYQGRYLNSFFTQIFANKFDCTATVMTIKSCKWVKGVNDGMLK